MNNAYRLSDEAIAALVKMLQLAMLTGTDISDWFRMLQLQPDDESMLRLDPNYAQLLNDQISALERQAQSMLEDASKDDGSN